VTRIRCTFALIVLFVSLAAFAQQAPAPAPAPTPAPATFDPASAPHVISVTGFGPKGGPKGGAGLTNRLSVTVRNFPKLLADASGNCRAIVLYIDSMPLRGMPPESCNPYDGTVRYLLDRVPEQNDEQWHRILGSPDGFSRNVRVSVGANDEFAVPTDVTAFPLIVVPRIQFYVFIALLVAFLLIFIHLCRTTSIIRAPVDPARPGKRPYSLSRFQMGFWFFLVISGYVFAWMVTGELDTITDSILALIGIGAGTALGAAVIDAAPATTATETMTSTAATTDGTAQVTTSVKVPVAAPPPPPSQGFLHDVLSDNDEGISMHRFQMFAWTLILGVIFVSSVYKSLAMPEFSTTLLGLMGISSGTYLGFKFPEKKRSDQEAAATNAATPTT
jgi:hypothetical protein